MQLVEALHYKMGGFGFDSQWGPLKFSIDLILQCAFSGPGVHAASNRNEYQGISLQVKCGQHVEWTTLPSHLRQMSK
jgi:hypothetical protein